jgi:hypothetical protein
MTERQPDRERCGIRIQYSESVFDGRPGAYRVSKDGRSNIIDEATWDALALDADSRDSAFEEVMNTVLSPNVAHPFRLWLEPGGD